MRRRRRGPTFNRRAIASLAVLVLLLASCGNPAPTVVSAPPASTAPVAPSALALAECDPNGLVPCNQQAAFLSIPIADTGLALTYSSEWALGRTDRRPGWSAASLGLAGWSLDVIQRYDRTNNVLIGGNGSWRIANSVPAGSGRFAVPTHDATTAYVFDATGRHVQTVDGYLGSPSLTIAYDAAGRLDKVDGTVNGQAAHLTVQRSADGTPRALVGTDGAITSLTLDGSGNLTGIENPAGATTSVAWATGGLPTSETDPLGGVTRYIYDTSGLLVGSTDADGVAQQLSRSATSTSVEVKATSTQGRVSTYRSEAVAGGLQRSYVAPDGTSTTEITAPDGSWTMTLPDGTTRSVGSQPSSTWGLAAPIETPDVEARPDGVVSRTEVTQNLSPSGGLPFELSGSVTNSINGQAWVTTYDPASRTTTTTDPVGKKTVETYDTAGRLVAQSIPGNAPVTFTYDPDGREASQSVGAGASALVTRFAYDMTTGTISMTRPDGKIQTVAIDGAGHLASTSEPDGSTTLVVSDADGRPTQIQPAGGLSFTLGTSPAGRPTAFLPPSVGSDGSIQTTSYDSDGNLATVSGLGTRTMKAAYDAAGQLTGWTFDQGSLSVTYDPTSGLLATEQDSAGETTAFGYAGNVPDKLTWSGTVAGSVSTTLDPNGRTVAESADGSPPITLAYDPSGALDGVGQLTLTRDATSGLVTATTIGAIQTADQYDANELLVRSTTTAAGKVVLDLQYTRDVLGRIVTEIETDGDGSTKTTTYSYDGADRLAQVQVNGKTVETDTYDGAGNRTSVATPTGTAKAVYDARDRLVSWGATTYAWNADGSLSLRADGTGSTSFKFDDFGRLRGVTPPTAQAVSYVVDADGRRVGRSVNGQLVAGYLYDPAGQVIAATDGTGAITERFGYDDQGHLALLERGSSSYRVITDPVGSPRVVIDSGSGAIVDAITYDAWGRITSETAPDTIPFGFGGGLLDPTTGFVHFGARDYDPSTGRWTSADPIGFAGGQSNLYAFVNDDPVNAHDASGLGNSIGTGGVTFGFSGVTGVGPVWGVNVQWVEGSGFNVYPYVGYGIGIDVGGSVTANGGTITNPSADPAHDWSGFSNNASLGAGPAAIGGFNSSTPGGPSYGGNSVGYGASPIPFGGSLTKTYSWCITCPSSGGETHLLTGDRLHVDFQAAGEFIAAVSRDRAFEIQARQQSFGVGSDVSFNTAVAANVAGDRVGVYAREPSFLRVNGVAVAASDVAEQLPHGGTLERHGGVVTIGWPDGGRLVVWQVANTLNYTFAAATGVGATLRGLLGNADGNPANDLTGRDGVVLATSDPAFATKLYSQFGNSWRVKPGESLFDYQPGESTATFTNLGVPTSNVTAASLPSAVQAIAQAVCRAVGVETQPTLDDCILDVGVTGEPAFAATEAAIAAAGPPPVPATATPPTSTGSQHQLILGQAVSGTIASASQHDDYTLSATSGEIVYLRAQSSCSAGLQWALLAPDSGIKDAGPACQDIGREVLATAGIWTVRISSTGTTTGAYAFTVSAVPAVVTTVLSLGQAVTGAISQVGAWNDYAFSASIGDIVYLHAQGSCVTGLDWELLPPDGSIRDSGPACQDIGREVLSAAGTWTVRLYSDSTATGAYAFTVFGVPAPTTTSLVIGQPLTGSISQVGQWINATFNVSAGEKANLIGSGSCVTGLDWALVRPDGTMQDSALTCQTIGPETLSTGGMWTVRIYSDTTATGAYSVEILPGS